MAATAKADDKSIRVITFSGAPSAPSDWFTYKQRFIMKFSCLGHGGHLAKSVKTYLATKQAFRKRAADREPSHDASRKANQQPAIAPRPRMEIGGLDQTLRDEEVITAI
jgi:hypothetical protein